MADERPETGGVFVAHDLYMAIATGGFTALERGVIDAVIYFTYGAGKNAAKISVEDIRYLLGAGDSLRTDRLNESLTKLIRRRIVIRQATKDGGQVLAMQRDFNQWADKMSPTLQDSNTNTVTTSIVPDKMSATMDPPTRLLAYAQRMSKFKYGTTAWRVERKQARLLYQEVLTRVKSGEEAFNLICDYIDENEWMRLNVKMQFTFMASRFEAWRAQVPRKPKEIREDEEAIGKRYRYDTKLKKWLPADMAARKEVEAWKP